MDRRGGYDMEYTDGRNITCEKEGFQWKLAEPVAATADASEVEKLISELSDLLMSIK